jgi:RHS repeat-associated protein
MRALKLARVAMGAGLALQLLCLGPGSVQAQTLYFIQADHLNTPRLITNSAGAAVWRWDNQEPFGNDVPNENPSGLGTLVVPLRFPGQYFDRETNLAYNFFRDYDPAIGRYVQSDPIGLIGGLNTYSYVRGNPISLTDPRGESWQVVVVVVVVGTWAINWTYWNVINPEPSPGTPPAPPLPPTGDNGLQCGPNFGAPPPPDLTIPGPWPDPRLSRPIQSPVGPPPQRPVPVLR